MYIKKIPIATLVLVIVATGCVQNAPLGVVGSVHNHVDFKLYINNVAFNFSQEKYMTDNKTQLSRFVHMHDLDGDVIHIHATGVTLGLFFHSLNMTFNATCIQLDNGSAYCNNGANTVKLYVNSIQNNDFGSYEPKDLDRILVSYGDSSQIDQQIASVTDKACIQSGKCPERGNPENESSCLTDGDCVA